jgi:hypothetical protein
MIFFIESDWRWVDGCGIGSMALSVGRVAFGSVCVVWSGVVFVCCTGMNLQFPRDELIDGLRVISCCCLLHGITIL